VQPAAKAPFQEKNFKRVVVVSTALAFAFMIGLLSSIQGKTSQGLQFGWNWGVLVWIAAAIACNGVFWRQAWTAQAAPTPANKRRFLLGCCLMGLLGLAAFLYPMRFSEKSFSHWFSLIHGLVTAVLFLSALGWIFYKFIRMLDKADEVELKRQNQ
jgi:hypothetical protein